MTNLMPETTRQIGPIGTASRAIAGLGLLYLAIVFWKVDQQGAIVGLLVLPAASLAVGLILRRYASGPVHFTGLAGLALNFGVIVALVANPYTADGAALFYGITMLIAAWRGQPGCEGTVISNLILGRDDQIGCPVFEPVDEVEKRISTRRNRKEAPEAAGLSE